jgi:ubiquinone/menaquinone biosynthesis C-methylase UbiE
MGQTAKSIMASDVSLEMLEEARRKTYACPTTFTQADLFNLPFEPKSFDLITLGYWYSHHSRDDYETLYDILRRPLRDGGRIWMCDNNPPAEGSKTDSVGKDERGNNIKARWTSDGREYHIIKNYFSEGQLRELISPHFEIETFVYKPYYWWMVLGVK